MATFESIKKVTVTEQIMDQIAGLITSGNLQPGEQLPPERDLAAQLGVTRGRIREALRALSLVGLVTIKAGEGTFVSRVETPIPGETIAWLFHKEIDNLDEIYAARRLIETEIYAGAAEAMPDEELARLTARIQDFEASIAAEDDAERLLSMLDDIDMFVGEHCGNRVYAKLMQTMVHLRRQTSLKLLAVPGAAGNGADARALVAAALKARDKAGVTKAMHAFFDSSLRFYREIGQ